MPYHINWRIAPLGVFNRRMRDLVRTNDLVVLNYAVAILKDAGIEALVFDQHMSFAEGSIGAFPRRLVVADALFVAAANTLRDAGLGSFLHDGD